MNKSSGKGSGFVMEGVSRSSVCIDQMGKNRVVFIKLPRERALTKMSKIFSYI